MPQEAIIYITNQTNYIYITENIVKSRGLTLHFLQRFFCKVEVPEKLCQTKGFEKQGFSKRNWRGSCCQPLSNIEEQILSVANHEVEVSSKYVSESAQIRQSDLGSMKAIGFDDLDIDLLMGSLMSQFGN